MSECLKKLKCSWLNKSGVLGLNLQITNIVIFFKLFLGVWLSAFSLGNFVGPTIAGILVQTESFRTTTLIFFCLYIVMVIVDSIEAILNCRRSPMFDRRSQYESLENDEN